MTTGKQGQVQAGTATTPRRHSSNTSRTDGESVSERVGGIKRGQPPITEGMTVDKFRDATDNRWLAVGVDLSQQQRLMGLRTNTRSVTARPAQTAHAPTLPAQR